MRYMLTDELWNLLAPHVEAAKVNRGGSAPILPDRMFFEAILYLARTGVPWRDLPGDFGAWDAVYNRFGRWVRSGSLKALFERLTDNPDLGEVRRLLVDSTTNRAHAHAAGARRKKKRSGPDGRRRSKVSAAAGAGSPRK